MSFPSILLLQLSLPLVFFCGSAHQLPLSRHGQAVVGSPDVEDLVPLRLVRHAVHQVHRLPCKTPKKDANVNILLHTYSSGLSYTRHSGCKTIFESINIRKGTNTTTIVHSDRRRRPIAETEINPPARPMRLAVEP